VTQELRGDLGAALHHEGFHPALAQGAQEGSKVHMSIVVLFNTGRLNAQGLKCVDTLMGRLTRMGDERVSGRFIIEQRGRARDTRA